jgi:hypothetical protein
MQAYLGPALAADDSVAADDSGADKERDRTTAAR